MKVRLVCLLALMFYGLLAGSPARAYTEKRVENGGVLEGMVYLDGEPPPARIFHLIHSPNIEFCSRISDGRGNRLLKEFRVDTAGGFQNVVVALVGVSEGKPFDYEPVIEIENCRMGPFVLPVRNGNPVRFVNRDPIIHDPVSYTMDGKGRVFEVFKTRVLAEDGITRPVRLRPGHFIAHFRCGVHPFMQAWGIALGNPYFAVTDESGRYRIDEIPPGRYLVIAWHPHLEVLADAVTIYPGGTERLDFRFDAAQVRIPLHDLQTGYRFKPVLQPEQVIWPTVEYQMP